MRSRDEGQVALVTGASRGIGAAIARRLAADGMAVAINSYPDESMLAAAKHVAAEIEHSGGHAAVYPADISDPTAVDTLFSRCEEQLVNCVLPGTIRAEEELEVFPDQAAVHSFVLNQQILQRRGHAEDVAAVVSFLLGPDSRFMTGQAVCVDGGWVPV